MTVNIAQLRAELIAADDSGDLSEFARDLLREVFGVECAAVVIRRFEQPQNADDRDIKIDRRNAAMRAKGVPIEERRQRLHAEFDPNAVDFIMEHGLRSRTRKKLKARRKIPAILAGVSGRAPT